MKKQKNKTASPKPLGYTATMLKSRYRDLYGAAPQRKLRAETEIDIVNFGRLLYYNQESRFFSKDFAIFMADNEIYGYKSLRGSLSVDEKFDNIWTNLVDIDATAIHFVQYSENLEIPSVHSLQTVYELCAHLSSFDDPNFYFGDFFIFNKTHYTTLRKIVSKLIGIDVTSYHDRYFVTEFGSIVKKSAKTRGS